MDIVLVLSHGWKGSEWTLDGEDYSGLVWLSDSPKPTMEEIAAAYPAALAEAQAKAEADAAARAAAIAHAKSLGFTDDMIAMMYPGLTV